MKLWTVSRAVMAALACTSFAGCGMLPVVPPYNPNKLVQGDNALKPMSVYDARALTSNWQAALTGAANDRRNAELVAGELQFYGTLLFAATSAYIVHMGGATNVARDVVRARNWGAAAGFGSTVISQHYNWAAQRTAFTGAAARMKCAWSAIEPLNPALRELLTQADIDRINAKLQSQQSKETFETLWAAVAQRTRHFVEFEVNPDLQNALNAITLSTPPAASLADSLEAWKNAKDKGGEAAKDVAKNGQALTATSQSPSRHQYRRTMSQALTEAETRVPDTVEAKTMQELLDREAVSNKSSVELSDMRSQFVIALVSFNSALALCK